jgi:hypothetical protein
MPERSIVLFDTSQLLSLQQPAAATSTEIGRGQSSGGRLGERDSLVSA